MFRLLSEITNATTGAQSANEYLPKLRKNSILPEKIIRRKYRVCLFILFVLILGGISLYHVNLIDWDEGVFALQAEWLKTLGAEGKPFNFQTPPLYQILIAISFAAMGVHDYLLPVLSIIASALSVYVLIRFARLFFSKEEALYALLLFITSEFFLFFSKSGLSDAVFLCLCLSAIYLFFKGVKLNRTKDFVFGGMFIIAALYTKYSAPVFLIAFLIIGLVNRRTINKYWYLYTVVIPILCYLPFLYLFISIVHIPEIASRNITLVNFNHIKYLVYFLLYAPAPFIFSILYFAFFSRKIVRWEQYLLLLIVIFCFAVGFYRPYFRLGYVAVPLICVFAARFIGRLGKYRHYILAVAIIICLIVGYKTIMYRSAIPKKTADLAEVHAEHWDVNYVFAAVPPNVYFYMSGSILVKSNHPWMNMGQKFPILMRRKTVIYPETNELQNEEKILFVRATVFDSIKLHHTELFDLGQLLETVEFEDAPVYNKDFFNPLKNVHQQYEIYLFDRKTLGTKIDDLWRIGFNRQIEVILR